MAEENEVESLVVRLTGDAAEYKHMLEEAVHHTEHAAHEVEGAAHHIEGFEHSLEEFAHNAERALAAIGVGFELKEVFEAFSGQQSNLIRLRAVLESNGRQVEETMTRYHEFAEAEAEVSLEGRDSILQLLKQAETFGLTGAAAERAATAAIAFASVNGGQAESFIRLTNALEKHDAQLLMGMKRLVPQLREAKNESELFAIAQRLVATGIHTAAELANSPEGRMVHFQHAVHELHEELGAFVAEAVMPVVQWLTNMVQWLRELSPEVKRNIVYVAGLVAGLLALGPAIAIAKALFFALFSPTNLLIAGVIYGVVKLIEAMGGIKEVALKAEFAFTHIGEVANVAWTAIKYGLAITGDFFRDVLIGMVATALATTRSINEAFVSAWRNIRGIVTGESENIAEAMGREFTRVFGEVSAAMGAGTSEVTRRLGAELATQNAALTESFESWREAREEAEGHNPFAAPAASTEEIKKNLQAIAGLTQALFGSAEARSRLEAFSVRGDVARGGGYDPQVGSRAAAGTSEMVRSMVEGVMRGFPNAIRPGMSDLLGDALRVASDVGANAAIARAAGVINTPFGFGVREATPGHINTPFGFGVRDTEARAPVIPPSRPLIGEAPTIGSLVAAGSRAPTIVFPPAIETSIGAIAAHLATIAGRPGVVLEPARLGGAP